MNNSLHYIAGFIFLIVFTFHTKTTEATPVFGIDSIGIENNNGKQVIVHQLESKETYYSLSRKYGVSHREIMTFNNNKSLKIGDIVKIPSNRPYQNTSTSGAPSSEEASESTTPDQPSDSGIRYKVGAGETLYTIAKRFQVSVAQIVAKNNLENGRSIKAGQTILIPDGTEESEPVTETPEPEATGDPIIIPEKNTSLPAQRYGLRQIDERGVGVWLEGLNSDSGNMLALHKTAPVGTVVKITNPMNQKITFAKIVGKYTENATTHDAVIVISKATADLLGILDKRFLINISYGVPDN
ncbi:DPBB and LysM peptidoglycan-binding domain-containing protein [Albibacterium profundi]|uniref:LysM peptidoglycan-binding domain-containing protein n=1 Tax=Albibacterium profundi TaxID=3134906 RepID=A0ABV5CG63_9SPHI